MRIRKEILSMKQSIFLLLLLSIFILIQNCDKDQNSNSEKDSTSNTESSNKEAKSSSSKNSTQTSKNTQSMDFRELQERLKNFQINVPENFVFKPRFNTNKGNFAAGIAFFLKIAEYENPIFITPLHLFSEIGGLPDDVVIPPTELKDSIQEIILIELFNENKIHLENTVITIPNSAPNGQDSKAGDIAAFWGPTDVELSSLELAKEKAQPGDFVWMVLPEKISLPKDKQNDDPTNLFPALVVPNLNDNNLLYYRFINQDVLLFSANGAPILNSNNKIVGMNIAKAEPNGIKYGIANPVDRFRPYLLEACKKTPAPEN